MSMSMSICSSSASLPFECRSDSDFLGCIHRPDGPAFSCKLVAAFGRGQIVTSSLILRFGPRFVTHLNNKDWGNGCNIGFAQIVAASWSNDHPLSSAAESDDDAITVSKISVGEEDVDNDDKDLSTSVQFEDQPSVLNGDGSIAIHAGERWDRSIVTDSITTPIFNTSAYFFNNTAELIDFKEKRRFSFEYGRYGNYTTEAVEKKISELEEAESTMVVASRMYAITVMMLALIPIGGHIITTSDCYRKTRIFIETVLPKLGITVTVIDPADYAGLESALDNHKVSLVFTESPTNPFLRCVDIELVSKLCHAKGAIVCIDGTFASPINQKALELGADIVLHSATKYIGGHNDVIAGSLSGSTEIISQVRNLHHVLGGVLNPYAASLLVRGMKTLELRVQQQNETAQRMAEVLEAHPKVKRVYYPGLQSHPEHHIAKNQMIGFGGVVSFEVDGDFVTTSKFIDALKIPYIAPSFGGCESFVDQPALMSYWDLSQSDRAKYGIMDNLVRFSFGVEDYEDLEADVLQALKAI